MIRILVDSASDYEMEEIKEKNLEFVPISILLNGKNYRDGLDLNKDDFFEMLVRSVEFPKTSQPSPQDFLTLFQAARENGDELICLLLSSGLSGTCQSAHLAKSMADYDGIYIIDTLSATYPIKVLADYACTLIKEGLPAREIAGKLEQLKSRVRLFAVLDTLEYLSKGGRIPRSIAAIGDMARLKPVITLNAEGQVGVLGKCLGRNKAVSALTKTVTECEIDHNFPVYTIYSYGEENCCLFEEKLADIGIHPDRRLQIGATIGAHIGPGAFGIILTTCSKEG